MPWSARAENILLLAQTTAKLLRPLRNHVDHAIHGKDVMVRFFMIVSEIVYTNKMKSLSPVTHYGSSVLGRHFQPSQQHQVHTNC